MVECARLHLDQDLVFAQHRYRNVFVPQDLGPTELVKSNCFHVVPERGAIGKNLTQTQFAVTECSLNWSQNKSGRIFTRPFNNCPQPTVLALDPSPRPLA